MYILLMHYFPATSILEGQENIFEDAMKKGPKTFLVSKVYYKPYPLEMGRNMRTLIAKYTENVNKDKI